jgi:tetratricopeptide (TPR) repeat protein
VASDNPDSTTDLPDFDKLWNYGKPEETEKQFRALLPAARASGNSEYLLQVQTQIARTLGLRREFESSHNLLDEVEGKLSPETLVARIRYLWERGRTFNSDKKPETASPLFVEAFDLAKSTGQEYYAVDAAHMLGVSERDDASLFWNEKEMQVAETAADERAKGWLGSLYNNTGWTYHDTRQYEKALELFEKGLLWRQARGNEKSTLIAKWTVARTLRSLERCDEALDRQLALQKEYKASECEPDGYVSEEIGECLLALGKKKEATRHFADAYALLSKDDWLKAEEPERLERLKKLGGVTEPQ